MKRVGKILLTAVGFVALGLGLVGVVLPVIPSIPLLMLACFCLEKGSKRFHTWLLKSKFYKKYLADYEKTGTMTVKTKLKLCLPCTIFMILSIILIHILVLRIIFIAIILVLWWFFIFKVKTAPKVPKS